MRPVFPTEYYDIVYNYLFVNIELGIKILKNWITNNYTLYLFFRNSNIKIVIVLIIYF